MLGLLHILPRSVVQDILQGKSAQPLRDIRGPATLGLVVELVDGDDGGLALLV